MTETCVICLNESGESKIIEYNHCGLYYMHESCLNEWKLQSNDCIICREPLPEIILEPLIVVEREEYPQEHPVCIIIYFFGLLIGFGLLTSGLARNIEKLYNSG